MGWRAALSVKPPVWGQSDAQTRRGGYALDQRLGDGADVAERGFNLRRAVNAGQLDPYGTGAKQLGQGSEAILLDA